jgi:recombination protein RecT
MPELQKLSVKVQTTRAFLTRLGPELAKVLPRTVTPERLMRVVITDGLAQVQRNRPGAPTIFDCTEASLASAILQVAGLNLEPGGVLGQAHLIPYKNKSNGTTEAQLQIGFRGYIALALRSGLVTSITPVVVHARDRYIVHKGTTPSIVHEPYRPTADVPLPGEAIAYYVVAMLKAGVPQFDEMYKAEVEAHRDRFARATGPGTPWAEYFDAMALKTVVKRLCKVLPSATEPAVAEAFRLDERDPELDAGLGWIPEPGGEGTPAPASKLDEALASRRRAGPAPGQAELAEAPAEAGA